MRGIRDLDEFYNQSKEGPWFEEFAWSGDLIATLDVDGIALTDRNGYLVINSGTSGTFDGAWSRTIVSYTEDRDCITRMYSLVIPWNLSPSCRFFRMEGWRGMASSNTIFISPNS